MLRPRALTLAVVVHLIYVWRTRRTRFNPDVWACLCVVSVSWKWPLWKCFNPSYFPLLSFFPTFLQFKSKINPFQWLSACVCVSVAGRKRKQTVSQSADCFSSCSRPEWWARTSWYHSTLSASGSNQSNLLPRVLRSTPWSGAKTWCFLLSCPRVPLLTKGKRCWILAGEQETSRTCQEWKKQMDAWEKAD